MKENKNLEIKTRTKKYIVATGKALSNMKMLDKSLVSEIDVRMVLNSAKNYYIDAQHYMETEDFTTALASITYCEGLMDALKFMGFADFSW